MIILSQFRLKFASKCYPLSKQTPGAFLKIIINIIEYCLFPDRVKKYNSENTFFVNKFYLPLQEEWFLSRNDGALAGPGVFEDKCAYNEYQTTMCKLSFTCLYRGR